MPMEMIEVPRMCRLILAFLLGVVSTTLAGETIRLVPQLGHVPWAFVFASETQVAISPDRRLVLTTNACMVHLWDAGVGGEIGHPWDVPIGREIGHFEADRENLRAAQFTPDGKHIVTGGWDTEARLWDVATHLQVRSFAHTRKIEALAVSRDGRFLLTGGNEGSAKLWEIATGKLLRSFSPAFREVNHVGFSTDGCRVLLAGREGVDILDRQTGEPIQAFPDRQRATECASLSPDNQHVMICSEHGTMRLWTVATGLETHRYRGHPFEVHSIVFSPDGRRVLTTGDDGFARLWDVESEKELHAFTQPGIMGLAVFSHDGKNILHGCEEGAYLLDATDFREIRKFERLINPIHRVAFSPTGRFILAQRRVRSRWEKDRFAWIWNLERGRSICRIFLQPLGGEPGAVFAPNSESVLAGCGERTLRLWDPMAGKPTVSFAAKRQTRGHAFSGDGRLLVTGSWGKDSFACVWDVASGRLLHTLGPHASAIWAIAFSRDGRHVATACDNMAFLWDAASGKKLHTLEGHQDAIQSVQFSADGGRLWTTAKEGRLWNVETGQPLARIEASWHDNSQFSPDGKFLLAIGQRDAPKAAHLFDATTGRVIRRFNDVNTVCGVAFSPDGRKITTATYDGDGRIWDIETGESLYTLKECFYLPPQFSPQGRYFIVRERGACSIHNAQMGRPVFRMRGVNRSALYSALFSPDDRHLIAEWGDGTARLFDCGSGKELCTLANFIDGTWAVWDADGRYDASNDGDIEGLCWVVDGRPRNLASLKDRYHEPGLLAKLMGFDKTPLRAVQSIREPDPKEIAR